MRESQKNKTVTGYFLSFYNGRRIYCVVMYIDMVSSTKIVRRLAPKDKKSYYRIFLDEIIDVVSDFNGIVLKIGGDSVIALFPAIKYFTGPVDTAVLCGLTILEVVKNSLSPFLIGLGLPAVSCRIAADLGFIEIARIGKDGFYVSVDCFGDVMNIAAKIQSKADPDTMFIGQELFEHIYTAFRLSCKQVGDLQFNGEIYPYYRITYPL